MNVLEEHKRLMDGIPDAKASDLCDALLGLLREHRPLVGHVFHRDSRECPDHRDDRVPARPGERQTYIQCPTCVTFFRNTCASRECMYCEGWPCPTVRIIREALSWGAEPDRSGS